MGFLTATILPNCGKGSDEEDFLIVNMDVNKCFMRKEMPGLKDPHNEFGLVTPLVISLDV